MIYKIFLKLNDKKSNNQSKTFFLKIFPLKRYEYDQ